jgi:hypothetical protein
MVQVEIPRTASADIAPDRARGLEALIKEAQQRKRRRWRIRGGIATSLAALGLALASFASGGGGTSQDGRPSRPAKSPSTAFGACLTCSARSSATALAHGHWVTFPAGPLQPRIGQVGLWAGHQLLVWGGASSKSFGDGAAFDPFTKRWRLLPKGPLSPRSEAASVWTGTQALIWGGASESTSAGQSADVLLSNGASYDPSTRSWQKLPPAPLSARQDALAFWTGSQMIVFGGGQKLFQSLLTGAIYSPESKHWNKMPAFPRQGAKGSVGSISAAWTGHRLIVWATLVQSGPCGTNCYGSAPHQVEAEWTPGSPTWRTLPNSQIGASTASGMPIWTATPVWTGTRVVLVHGTSCIPAGGTSCPSPSSPIVGAEVYQPSSKHWSATPATKVLGGDGPVLWTGRALLAVNTGETFGTLSPGDGVVYEPKTKRWLTLPRAPTAYYGVPTYVWTGKSLLIWGQDTTPVGGEELVAKG